jgi:hypothetical protein
VETRAADLWQDINRITRERADPALANLLVDSSRETIQWLVDNGARFTLSFNRQSFETNGKYKFWGGMVMTMIGWAKSICTSNILIRPNNLQAKAKVFFNGTSN